eukprot:6104763-Alexandrium_andersonii.AAC.1
MCADATLLRTSRFWKDDAVFAAALPLEAARLPLPDLASERARLPTLAAPRSPKGLAHRRPQGVLARAR